MVKTYIIAELGNTHEGSLGLAKCFIKAAAECGVDAVKMQTHIFDAESLPNAPNPPYFKDETRKQYFDRTSFTIDQWKELKDYCEKEMGIDFFSSPFSLEAVDILEDIDVKTYKIASGEVTNIPLLVKIARTGKKILLSSGMNSWQELDEAVKTLLTNGSKDIVILQCTSEYPCQPEASGLNVLKEMKERYGKQVSIGYSDHTLGVAIPVAAVVMGASVIEKHFTLSKSMYGSDAKNATEPNEFKILVNEIRSIEKALNNKVDKDEKVKSQYNMKMTFEKSIVAACDIKADKIITESMLAYKKPGDGIPANEYKSLIGMKLIKSVAKNYKIKREDLK